MGGKKHGQKSSYHVKTKNERRRERRGEKEEMSVHSLHRRAELMAVYLRNYPEDLARKLSASSHAGWPFGRLFLIGAISLEQYEAAQLLDRTVSKYRVLLNTYSSVRTTNYGQRVSGSSVEDLSPAAQEAFRRAKEAHDRAIKSLMDAGSDVHRSVVSLLEDTGHLPALYLIRRGLDALLERGV